MFCSEEKNPQILPFDHLSQYIKTDQNGDKKDFHIHHFVISFSFNFVIQCLSWAALFGSSGGSWVPSAFPQTFMDNIKNCQVITHEHEHEQKFKTSNYRIHINS